MPGTARCFGFSTSLDSFSRTMKLTYLRHVLSTPVSHYTMGTCVTFAFFASYLLLHHHSSPTAFRGAQPSLLYRKLFVLRFTQPPSYSNYVLYGSSLVFFCPMTTIRRYFSHQFDDTVNWGGRLQIEQSHNLSPCLTFAYLGLHAILNPFSNFLTFTHACLLAAQAQSFSDS